MAEKLSHVVRRIGESASTLLDVKIALSRATGQLAPTLVVIRDMLGELEAREIHRTHDANTGRALLAQRPGGKPAKPNKPVKKRDPKRTEKPNTFASQWNAKYGACRHCGGKHWHRDCPRRPKPDAAAKKGDTTNGALTTAAPESELFAKDGGATVSFSVPSDARALCAHDSVDSVSFSHEPMPSSPMLSEQELAEQDEAELEANEERNRKYETSDSEYDSDRPYGLW
eukprot:3106791-Pleurochrysis_carterae.AAC.1